MVMELRVEGAEFAYERGRPVFRGVELAVRSPEIFCILGVNGAGKSTLLKSMAGLLPLNAGRILCDGRDIAGLSRRETGRMLAYLPQTHAPLFPFSALEVALMGRTAHLPYMGVPGARDREKALAALEFLGIGHLAGRNITEISGGERQLVMLAAALAQEPCMMLLDEPVSHLDYGHQYRFLGTLKKLAASGVGIVMTTHFPDHALLVGDTAAILGRGGIEACGKPEDVITGERMSALYGIPVEVRKTPEGCLCRVRLEGGGKDA